MPLKALGNSSLIAWLTAPLTVTIVPLGMQIVCRLLFMEPYPERLQQLLVWLMRSSADCVDLPT